MPEQASLSFAQIQAAMQAMINRAMQTPAEPVAMAIVDATGNLLAYNTMDNLRLYSRRHALRKATGGLHANDWIFHIPGPRPAAAQPGEKH